MALVKEIGEIYFQSPKPLPANFDFLLNLQN